MSCNKLYLYFFSGTGNSRQTALWMQEEANIKGWETKVYELSQQKAPPPLPDEGSMVGFISPTHGFHFPAIMRRFLRRFPRVNNCRAFVVNTRAGIRIGKIFLPGLSGLVHYVSSFLLWKKGYKIVGLYPVDLPSNWISLHPTVRNKGVRMMYERLEPKVRRFTSDILNGKRRYRALISLPFDIAIAPLALGYLFVGRYFLAKTFYASSACNNCRLCLESCPVGAIKERKGRMFWTWRCESCMKCMNLCPERAIETAHGFIALVIWASAALFGYLLHWLEIKSGANKVAWMEVRGVRLILVSALMVAFVFLSYRVMHYLLRFRAVERLMVWTSLTWWGFWGRYRPEKLKKTKQ